MNKYFRFLTDRQFRFGALAARGVFNFMSDRRFLEKKYFLKFGKRLNLENPQTYNEKLQWIKLYDRNPLYTTLVDKYAVREYIKNKIGEEYLIPLVGGPWKSFDEIDFDLLPDQFVLKCTHDSGGLVICKDKSQLNRQKAKEKLDRNLKRNYYLTGREWPYKNVPPQIIAEQYMEDKQSKDLKDYKFFAFDGEAKAMFIATDRSSSEETKFDFFDMEFCHLPFTNGHPNAEITPVKPAAFDHMRELAGKLSEGIPQARIDFYDIDGRVYFGEITLFHWGGMVPFEPEEWDKTFGDWINLDQKTISIGR